ncbi:unnamed protein product [Clonostachys byssicola]|uniref:Secreted protein n=1 Tax=Clonostachys byssicola TaxID=160290 RepID=A0A9N9Y1S8_9HYPO|nr:unnamed protein product [Clonostachys byssicola]
MKPFISLFVALHYLSLASATIYKPSDHSPRTRCFPFFRKKDILKEVRTRYDDEEGEALQVARKACESNFHGVWRRSTTRERCYNLGRHKHVRITVELSDASPEPLQSLASEECYRRLSGDITDCPWGSGVWYGVWRYRQVTLLR